MPTYLCHGFRWPRPLIRIHIILQNLDDAAAEWLMAPATTTALLDNFRQLYGTIMPQIPRLTFLEQYDPLDERAESKSQPYAYVCDVVHEVKLGVDIDEVRGKGVTNEGWNAVMELRDSIAPGEKVAWFVVVCGDTERWAPPTVGLLEQGMVPAGQSQNGVAGQSASGEGQQSKGGFRKLFGKKQPKNTPSSRPMSASPTGDVKRQPMSMSPTGDTRSRSNTQNIRPMLGSPPGGDLKQPLPNSTGPRPHGPSPGTAV